MKNTKKEYPTVPKKMTLEEYKKRFRRNEGTAAARSIGAILATTVCVVGFCCLFSIPLKLWDINEIAGAIGFAVAAVLFVILFVIPLIRLRKKHPFLLNPTEENLEDVKKKNRETLRSVAVNMVDLHEKTENDTWYSDGNIEKVKAALITADTADLTQLREALGMTYSTDVVKAAKKIKEQYMKKVAVSTALSQSEVLDSSLILTFEIGMIKDIVYLYGFRPTDEQLMKIYISVLTGAVSAYGLQNSADTFFTGALGKAGAFAEGIPFIGEMIAKLTSSAAQGMINATLTYLVGRQTQKYLTEDYRLQELLDGVVSEKSKEELTQSVMTEEDEQNLKEALREVKRALPGEKRLVKEKED